MANQTQEDRSPSAEESSGTAALDENGVADEERRAPWTSQSVDIPDESSQTYEFNTYPADRFTHEELGFSEEQVVEMYRNMLLQRRFEERCRQMYQQQKISGFLHLYIGQEAVSTGFGKKTGCSKGKGGSMHFFDAEKRMFGGHGIVGAQVPLGAGIAFAHKYRGEDNVCLCYFGDGAINQGAFHEAANLAGIYDLPLVMIVENNQYGMGTAVDRVSAEPDLYKRASAYDMPGGIASGMDVFSVAKAVREHAEMARNGQPSLLEVRTYRYQGHSISDPAKYRAEGELENRKSEDAIVRLQRYITEHGIASDDDLEAMDEDIKQEVLDAIDFADNSPEPDPSAIYDDVYVQQDYDFLA